MKRTLSQLLFGVGLSLAVLAVCPTQAATGDTLTANKALDFATLSSQLQSATGGTRVIKVAPVAGLGVFRLTSGTFDSLIFQPLNSEGIPRAIPFSGTLFDFENVGKLVIRDLVFEATTPSAVFLKSSASYPNKGLTLENCFIKSNRLDNTFATWYSGGSDTILLRRCVIVLSAGTTPKMLFSGARHVVFDHCLFQFDGLVKTEAVDRLVLTSNTWIRTSVQLSGLPEFPTLSNATLTASDNLFIRPGGVAPLALTHIGDLDEKNLLRNARVGYSAFTDVSNQTIFDKEPSNTAVTAVVNANEPWKWGPPYLTVASTSGAFAGQTALPAWNVFPSDDSLSIGSGNAKVTVHFDTCPVPRLLEIKKISNATLGFAQYRPWFRNEALVVKGRAKWVSLSSPQFVLPAGVPEQPPVLVWGSHFDKVKTDGHDAATGSYALLQTSDSLPPGADTLLPSLSGQNTPRGNAQALGVGAKITALADVLWPGNTAFLEQDLNQTDSAARPLLFGTKPVRLISSNAEIKSSLDFSLAESSVTTPYLKDSVYWFTALGNSGGTYVDAKAKRTGGEYRFSVAPQADSLGQWSLRLMGVEKLAIPRGSSRKTLPNSGVSKSELTVAQAKIGFQYAVDTSTSASTLGIQSHVMASPLWKVTLPGRDLDSTAEVKIEVNGLSANDSLYAYRTVGKETTFTVIQGERSGAHFTSTSLQKWDDYFFLGHPYTVKANKVFSLTQDSLNLIALLSNTFGEAKFLPLDSSAAPPSTQGKILATAALRFEQINPIQKFQFRFKLKTIKPEAGDSLCVKASNEDKGWRCLETTKADTAWVLDQLKAPDLLSFVLIRPPAKVVGDPNPPGVWAEPVLNLTPGKTSISLDPPAHNPAIDRVVVERFSLSPNGEVVLDTALRKASGNFTDTVGNVIPGYRLRYLDSNNQIVSLTRWAYPAETKIKPTPEYKALLEKKFQKHRLQLFGLSWPSQNYSLADLENTLTPDCKSDSSCNGYRLAESKLGDGNWAWKGLGKADTLQPGQALLFGAVGEWNPKVSDSLDLSLAPVSVPLKRGWNLISTPIPYAFEDTSIVRDPDFGEAFQNLNVPLNSTAKSHWEIANQVEPFKGYALYCDTACDHDGKLIFNPLKLVPTKTKAQAKLSAALKKSATASTPTTVGLRLEVQSQMAEKATVDFMKTRRGAHWLPTPEGSLDLWANDREAWRSVPQQTTDDFSIPVQVRVSQVGRYRFHTEALTSNPIPLAHEVSTTSRQNVWLMEAKTGQAYDLSLAPEITLEPGVWQFELATGPHADLARRTLKPVPQVARLNALARLGGIWVQIDIPSEWGYAVLELSVYDGRGRRGFTRQLGRLGAGHHALLLPPVEANTLQALSGQNWLRAQLKLSERNVQITSPIRYGGLR